ncbi:replicative DNA helicase [Arthrobacter sp. FW306-06-A]|uniref:replicative DNA helicase n=1 Tax=Arthrobacter sp. FW306-06-A TaxID=2879621 RepID=UPI001F2FE5BD|nr:replicative DNA helicase [Arthrobacter sp. FW306-06-A]UKA69559.1 replicative DNA helicase [Arthrobacter sp. FW306-06-A]
MNNAEHEMSVLGAMMLHNKSIPDVMDILEPGDFYRPANGNIFRAIVDLYARNEPADYATVFEALKRDGETLRAVGNDYLPKCGDAAHSYRNGPEYARIVAREAVRRRIASAGLKVADLAEQPGDEDELVEQARKAVDGVSRAAGEKVVSFSESIYETLRSMEADKAPFIPTPWSSVNHAIAGVRGGAMYVVGARPAVGKTVIGLQLAQCIARHGAVAFYSMEMTKDDLNKRLLASELHIPYQRLRDDALLARDTNKIIASEPDFHRMPLYVNDNPSLSITDIKRHARSVNRKSPLKAIVIDYIGLMSTPFGYRGERHQFIADMSRQLKVLSKEMDVPVIVLAQLNRGSEQRADKEPVMSDLRDSGAIEQDADVVLLLHRDLMNQPGDLYVRVAKNRSGVTGSFKLKFYGHYSKAVEEHVSPVEDREYPAFRQAQERPALSSVVGF